MQPLLEADEEKLDQIKDQLKDMVGQRFESIRVGSTKAHKTLKQSVTEKWEPAFKKAKKERGALSRSQAALQNTANKLNRQRNAPEAADSPG